MTIAITGHRPNKLGNDYALTSPLIAKIRGEIELIIANEQPDRLISGMALGIDTLFAKIAMDMNLPLICAIPCADQDKMWPQKSKDIYNSILNYENATIHQLSSNSYDRYCMEHRNRWMVDHCDLLIAVWDGSNGGTGNCVRYAKNKKKRIIYINPKEKSYVYNRLVR